jgi:hypothetical protein
MLLVTAIADARTDGPNSSGKYTAVPPIVPNTPNPTIGSNARYMAWLWTNGYRMQIATRPISTLIRKVFFLPILSAMKPQMA